MSSAISSIGKLSSSLPGLSETEAAARFQSDGPNELPSVRTRTFFWTIWEILREPMILMLVCAGVIYVFLGELRDSMVLMGSIFVIVGIELHPELFRFAPLHWFDIAICLGGGVASLVWFECWKILRNKVGKMQIAT
jgi:hypothetical protein